MKRFLPFIKDLLSGYASILFTKHPLLGLLFLAGTFYSPATGLTGLITATVALAVAKLLDFTNLKANQQVYNGLLVGLSLGVLYEFNIQLVILSVLAGFFVTWVTVAMVDLFWRLARLPALSVPFVLVAILIHCVAQAYAIPKEEGLLISGTCPFFSALGAAFFSPNPWIGFFYFLGIVWSSRYLALLSVCGYLIGTFVFNLFTTEPEALVLDWTGFNFILTSMAIGGLFTLPERRSFLVAMFGSALASLLVVAMQDVFLSVGPLSFVLPFLLSTACILLGLQQRHLPTPPYLTLDHPALPEDCYPQYRLNKARQSPYQGSVALQPPFYGAWQIYQGFYGPHTHKPPWQYALDFFVVNGKRSFKNDGTLVEEYCCFGLPVLAPCHGTVLQAVSYLHDNIPGEANLTQPWGNYLLIQKESGCFILLAHLKQHSLQVAVGEKVFVGQILGACGNSGRSLQPHLHMQVQTWTDLGCPTIPFHLSAVVTNEPKFYPVLCPKTGVSIQATQKSLAIAQSFHFPAGRYYKYRFREGEGEWSDRELSVKLNIKGQFKLVSDRGAVCVFEEQDNMLIFQHRIGPHDPFFDLFLLGLSVTPYAEMIPVWEDAPSSDLMPLPQGLRFLLSCVRPLDPGLTSQYKRHWDELNKCWHQFGEHQLKIAFNWRKNLHTHIEFYPENLFMRLCARLDQKNWTLELMNIGQTGDEGVPGWEVTNEKI